MFWDEKCPARGVALNHHHDPACVEHVASQCCECGSYAVSSMSIVLPPLDIQARLHALGLTNVAGYPVDEGAPHEEGELVEPKMITGDGPTGSPWGVGRGIATPRFLQRVVAYVDFVRVLGLEKGGDDAP